MSDFRLQIVTQQETVYDGPVTALTMPGEEGSFGVLAHHAAIISVLKPGPVKLRKGEKTQTFTIGAGFFEMERNHATLLVDSIQGLESNIRKGDD